jgi:DNA-binding NtrC family response regulator
LASSSVSDVELSASPSPSLLEIGRKAAWEVERRAILEMLAETHWNRREAARRLRVSYKALLNKISRIQSEQGMP